MLVEGHVQPRHVVRPRHRVVHQAPAQQLALRVVHDLLHQRGADRLRGAALQLALDDGRIDGAAGIVQHDVAQQPDTARLDVDLHRARLPPERPRHRVGIEPRAGVEAGLAAGCAERLGADGGLREPAERHRAIGNSGHERATRLEAHVRRRALEDLGGDDGRALAHLGGRAGDGGAGVDHHAAAAGAHAVGHERRVAAEHDDVVEARTELPRRDLREGGRVPLPLRGDADQHIDRALRIDANGGALERAQPGALRIARDADTDGPRRAGRRHLPLAPLVVAERAQHPLEGRRIVAGVVGDGNAILIGEAGAVRHLGGADQVAPAQIRRVQPEPSRAEVHEALHDEIGLGTTGRAIRGVEHRGGDDALAAAAVVRHAVRSRQVVHGVGGEAVAHHRIGADVGEEAVLERGDRPVGREGDARLVQLLAVVAHGLQMLAPSLRPLHRPAEVERRRRHQHLVGVDLALGAEGAADVGHDHAHPRGRQAEHARDDVALAVRALDRRPHGQHPALRVVLRERASALDRHRGQPLMPEALAHHGEPGSREGWIGVADVAAHLDGHVVGPVRMHTRGGGARGVRADQGRQRRVLHAHRVAPIGSEGRGLGHDDGDGLADVTRALAGQQRHDEAPVLRAAGRQRLREHGQVGGGPHRQHAANRPGRFAVDPDDARVSVGAAHDAEMDEAGPREVVHVAAVAAEEAGSILALR